MSARLANPARSRPLVGNFEENVLNNRLDPIRIVDGYTAEVRASCNLVQPSPLRSKVRVSIFSLDDCFPYLGQVDLNARKYKLPKKGTLQVTLFNPNGTLVKLWLLKYDLTGMPPNSQTFLRQKTFLVLKQTPPQQPTTTITLNGRPPNQNQDQNQCQSLESRSTSSQPIDDCSPTSANLNSSQKLQDRPIKSVPPSNLVPSITKRRIKYMIQFNIVSSKSGRIYLNKDLRIFVSKKVDLEAATEFSKQDHELKSFDEMPNNPRYFSR